MSHPHTHVYIYMVFFFVLSLIQEGKHPGELPGTGGLPSLVLQPNPWEQPTGTHRGTELEHGPNLRSNAESQQASVN